MRTGDREGAGDERKDYYFILGAEEDASAEELERRYKRLAVKHHPDRGGDEEEMKRLNEAYGVLGNREARDAYDAGRRSPARRRVSVRYASETAEAERPPYRSPSAQADAFGGRLVGAVLFVAVGLVLLLLVSFQFMWFLWPLALLALFLVSVGVMLGHAAMVFAREALAPTHPARRFVWLQETAFWLAVAGGLYGLYLVISMV